jgi:hypothetical protein
VLAGRRHTTRRPFNVPQPLTKRLKNAETLSKASAQDKGLCTETTPFFDVDRAWDAHALQS